MTTQPRLRLYHYLGSTSSWRVRWALALKELECEMVPIDLTKGESHTPEHLKRNPIGQVPVLEFVGQPDPYLAESVAIIEWLDETFPERPLLPRDGVKRARARHLAQIINANTHVLQNPPVVERHSPDAAVQLKWKNYWIGHGLASYETIVKPMAGTYSMGDTLSYPDIFLIPICRNALRFEVDLNTFPTIKRIYEAARKAPSCIATEPEAYKPL